jgi:phage regulator Rha-like protein
MLDKDLAALYEVETRALKQAVKRNIDRFPTDFMFELTDDEVSQMVSQNVIPSKSYFGGAVPYAFSEQGVAMLSSVLKSKKALQVNIGIVRAFVELRRIMQVDKDLAMQIEKLSKRLDERIDNHDAQLASIYEAMENLLDKEANKEAERKEWQSRQRIGFKK